MTNEPWLKLYKKIGEHPIMFDHKALAVFIWILTHVDQDGKKSISRYFTAASLRMKPATFYDVLKRLSVKHKVIEITPKAEYTEIRLSSWLKYQSHINPTEASPKSEQQPSEVKPTLYKELKNKNKEINREIYASLDYLRELPEKEIEELCKKYEVSPIALKKKAEGLLNYCVGHGKKYKNYRAMLLNALLKDFGYRKPTYTPNLIMPEQTPEERAKAREKINQIREQLHGSFKARV